jgi:hypothetical protein
LVTGDRGKLGLSPHKCLKAIEGVGVLIVGIHRPIAPFFEPITLDSGLQLHTLILSTMGPSTDNKYPLSADNLGPGMAETARPVVNTDFAVSARTYDFVSGRGGTRTHDLTDVNCDPVKSKVATAWSQYHRNHAAFCRPNNLIGGDVMIKKVG